MNTQHASNPDNPLSALAARMRGDGGAPSAGTRTQLEERLVPMIRCALRSGVGLPALVQWVRRTLPRLPQEWAGEPDQTAPRMARLLCAELFRQPRPAGWACGETVVGV